MKASFVIRTLRSREHNLRQVFIQEGRRDFYDYHEERNTLLVIMDDENRTENSYEKVSKIVLNFKKNKLKRTIEIFHGNNTVQSLNINNINRMRFLKFI